MKCRILELEKSLEVSVEQRAAERKGRIRAQQVHLSISVHLRALISVSAPSFFLALKLVLVCILQEYLFCITDLTGFLFTA